MFCILMSREDALNNKDLRMSIKSASEQLADIRSRKPREYSAVTKSHDSVSSSKSDANSNLRLNQKKNCLVQTKIFICWAVFHIKVQDYSKVLVLTGK